MIDRQANNGEQDLILPTLNHLHHIVIQFIESHENLNDRELFDALSSIFINFYSDGLSKLMNSLNDKNQALLFVQDFLDRLKKHTLIRFHEDKDHH